MAAAAAAAAIVEHGGDGDGDVVDEWAEWGGKAEVVQRRVEAWSARCLKKAYLDLWHLDLTAVSSVTIARLEGLHILNLGFNSIRLLPDELFKHPLVTLLAFSNELEVISPAIGDVADTLQKLSLNDNPLLRGIFPTEMWTLTSLTDLNLCKTGLTELPPEIGLLRALDTLFVCDNRELCALPEQLGDCSNLWMLYCTDCALVALPVSIGKLSVKYLACKNNPFVEGEPQTIEGLRARWERSGRGRLTKRARVVEVEDGEDDSGAAAVASVGEGVSESDDEGDAREDEKSTRKVARLA